MQESSIEYDALFTRDLVKKRKIWIDGKLHVNKINRNINIKDSTNTEIIFHGIIDLRTLENLLLYEETQINNLLVVLQKTYSENRPESLNNTSTSSTSNLKKGYISSINKPFKPPRAFINTSQINLANTIDRSPNPYLFNNTSKPFTLPVSTTNPQSLSEIKSNYGQYHNTSKPFTLPVSTSPLTQYHNTLKPSGLSINNGGKDSGYSLKINNYSFENNLTRRCKINCSFANINNYADTFLNAVHEEIILNIYTGIKSIDKSYTDMISKENSCRSLNQHNVNILNMKGFPIFDDITLIINHKDSSYDSNKKQKIDYENYRKIQSAKSEENSYKDKSSRFFLKVNESIKTKPSNNFKPTFSKGDIWILWDKNGTISSNPLQPFHGNLSSNSKLINQEYSCLLSEFKQLKKTSDYPFPWYKGFLFQETWLIRSVWHGFSSDKTLEFQSLDGSYTYPSSMCLFPYGKRNGPLSSKFSGVRVFSDCQLLLSYDLLSGCIFPSSENTLYFLSQNLMSCQIFSTILGNHSDRKRFNSHSVDDYIITSTIAELLKDFSLNEDQLKVIHKVSKWFSTEASSQEDDIILVQGIFGSGKSYLLAAICVLINRISNLLNNNLKCLISSNTNVAVDRVLIQILESQDKSSHNSRLWPVISRVGCLDKINRLLVHRGLYISSSENKKTLMNELEKTMKLDNDPSIINLAQNVINCSNFIENQKLKLENSNVIGVTCASSVSALLSNINCEILIIDEVSQLTEALTLLPIACAKPNKVLLIGDSNQLPPALCIQSSSSSSSSGKLSETEGDLSRTLFDRLKLLGHNEAILRTQYRCHPSIAEICNKLFYDNIIVNGTSPTERFQKIPKLSPIVSLHNDGSDFKLGDSYINKSESELVCNLLFYFSKLFNFQDSEKIENSQNYPTIGVICIYKAQVNEIHKRMNSNANLSNIIEKVTISTIDAFQGSEMDIIIICITKNAPTEFMNNKNRINVAISRAKYHLVIIGNINMLRSSSIWGKVLTFTQQNFQNIQAIYEFVG